MSFTRLIPGLLLIIIGLAALLKIDIWAYVWPLILILMGLKLIGRGENDFKFTSSGSLSQDELNEVVIFSEVKRTIDSENFEGGKFTTIFGSGNLDLRNVKMKQDKTEIEVAAIFGGMKILVPNTWKVRSEGVGILGSFDNDSDNNSAEKKSTLVIKGAAILGSVEIGN